MQSVIYTGKDTFVLASIHLKKGFKKHLFMLFITDTLWLLITTLQIR
jgi:hypothetical protein